MVTTKKYNDLVYKYNDLLIQYQSYKERWYTSWYNLVGKGVIRNNDDVLSIYYLKNDDYQKGLDYYEFGYKDINFFWDKKTKAKTKKKRKVKK